MKKPLAFLLSFTALACFGVAFAHSGLIKQAKADEVRVISSDDDFITFKNDLATDEMQGKQVRLDADINYRITESFTTETECAFRGTFDGNGHSITISVNAASYNHIGLFRSIGSQGSVSNLTVKGVIQGTHHIGGIAGFNYGLIENCINEAAISVTGQYVGGLVGVTNDSTHESNAARIINCENYGNVTTTYNTSASLGLGGLVGYAYGNTQIIDSSNYGNVTAGTAPFGVGGVLGVVKAGASATGDTYITNSYNSGTVHGDRYVGGILGHIDSGNSKVAHLNGCLNAGDIECTNASKGYDGQLIGNGKNASSFTIENSAILGSIAAGASSNVGQVVGYPEANTFTGVNVASTTGVSNNVKEFIQLVRHFNCDADASYKTQLTNALAALTNEEETLLSGVTYWDKSEANDLDYIAAANYILGYSPMAVRWNMKIETESVLPFIVSIVLSATFGLIVMALIRRRRIN